jgi:putative adenylate-forming enzyme
MVLGEILIGYEYLRTKRNLLRLQTRKQVELYQDREVRKLLKFAIRNSPYYKRRFGNLHFEDWKSFPIMDKSDWMGHFDEVNTLGITQKDALEIAVKAEELRDFSPTLKGVTVGLSSGTSGNRGLWLVSPRERYGWVGNILAKHMPDGLFSKERVAFFLRANSNLYATLGSSRLQFKFFDMLDPLEKLIKELNDYSPTIISAPPSMLSLLVSSGKLKIKPKRVFSVADVLEEQEERAFEEYFDIRKIDQFYQATEGFVATTCTEGTLHINEDMLVVQEEWIDRNSGRYTPIITDFQRFSQPIIRYRLNDVLISGDGCSCGSPFKTIKKIEGRRDDIIYLPNSSGELVPIFPDFFRQAIISNTSVRDYEIRQTDRNTLDVYLEGNERLSFDSLFVRYGVNPKVNYRMGIPLKKQDGKRRRIRSLN